MADPQIRVLNHYPKKTEYQKEQERAIAAEKGWDIESPLDPSLEDLIPQPKGNIRSPFGDLEHLVGPNGKMQYVQKLYGPWSHPVDAGYQPITKLGGPKGVFDATPRWYVDKKVEIALQGAVGGLVYVGTYNALNNTVDVLTAEGQAQGSFTAGQQVPAAAEGIKNYFLVVTTAGTQPAQPPLPNQVLKAGDWLFCSGSAWNIIPLGATTSISADSVTISPQAGSSLEGLTKLSEAILRIEEEGLFNIDWIATTADSGIVSFHALGNKLAGVYEKSVFTYVLSLDAPKTMTQKVELSETLPRNWYDGLLMPETQEVTGSYKSFASLKMLDETDLSQPPVDIGRMIAYVSGDVTKFALLFNGTELQPGEYIARYEAQAILPF